MCCEFLLAGATGSVVTKSTLAPFDCSTKGGVSTMDAEPSILCDGTGAHGRMKAVASVMIVVFVLGVPVGFAALLVYYRMAMRADQFLRVWGEGDTSVTNPNIHIRRRYRKLYEVRPSIVQLPESTALVRLRECGRD